MFYQAFFRLSAAVVPLVLILSTPAFGVLIETVPVGNPGNAPDDTGYGAVGYEYEIGTFEVTSGQYVEFLNAVAATDPYGLYHFRMASWGCQIVQSGSPGSYTYSIAADWRDLPVDYVDWGDVARFANWLHNGQPTGTQNRTTTEDGAYSLDGAQSDEELMAVTRNPGAIWAIPDENEWYKAAYHKNDGVTGNYWDYPTSSDVAPSNYLATPDAGNNANFYDSDWTVGEPYYKTPGGEFENSGSPYGTFDQGGNVWEWIETSPYELSRGMRGGSVMWKSNYFHCTARNGGARPLYADYTIGFRLVRLRDRLPGDLNGDDAVGSDDLNLVRANWGRSVDPGTAGDADGNGIVEAADLDLLRERWGETGVAAVPEPGMCLMILASFMMMTLTRRRGSRNGPGFRTRIPARTLAKYCSVLLLTLSVLHTTAKRCAAVDVYEYVSGYRATRMWLPDDLETVRGILIIGNGLGADARSKAEETRYCEFAKLHDFAVIGTAYWGNMSGDEILTFEAHLAAYAAQSNHPELVNAPWTPIGFSNGGMMSYGFNVMRPEKVIAFIASKAGYFNTFNPPDASLKTPGVLINGELDSDIQNTRLRTAFDMCYARGALWCLAEEEDLGHSGLSDRLVLPFMDQAIRLRYPEDEVPTATSGVTLLDVRREEGWYVDQSTWNDQIVEIASCEDYEGDYEDPGWVLNETMANLYRGFTTHDKDVSFQGVSTTSDRIYFGIPLPAQIHLFVNTAAVPDWSKVELFANDDCLCEVVSGGSPTDSVEIYAKLKRPGVHSLFALVTHADGVTMSTTGLYTYIVPVTSLHGDVDGDGYVAAADLDLVRAHWGESVPPGTLGDADATGVVDIADLELIRTNWGTTTFMAVPEPGVGVLTLIGAVLLGFRRCRWRFDVGTATWRRS